MTPKAPKDPNRIFLEEGHLIDEAVRKGAREAILRHKRAGQPIVVYENGQIVWVPADELPDEQPTKVAERPDSDYGEDE